MTGANLSLGRRHADTIVMLGTLVKLLSVLLVAYCAYAALLYSQQRNMMFPIASSQARPMRLDLPANAESLELPSKAGPIRVVLLKSRSAQAPAPAIVFTHGNAELVEELTRSFADVTALGVHVLLVEYPGYGGAPGAPSFDSLTAAGNAGFDWLAQRSDVDPNRIIAMGVSVGGGPACELTRQRPVRALVLMSTFTAVDEFARAMWLPAFLARDRFDNRARLREYDGPVLLLHGRHDEVIPFAHGRELEAAARHAQFIALDCGHNDCPYRGAGFARTLQQFLRSHGILAGG